MKRANPGGLLGLVALLLVSGFGLLAFQNETFDPNALLCGGAVLALLLLSYALLSFGFKYVDRHLLVIVYALLSLGMVFQYRIDPDVAFKQLIAIGIGTALLAVVLLLFADMEKWKGSRIRWVLMIGCVGFLALPLAIGSIKGGAKNWIDLGFFSLQPSEFVKVALVLILSSYLAERQKLKQLLVPGLFMLALLGLLVLERDLGAAVLFCGCMVAIYYSATGNVWATLGGFGLAAGASVLCYKLFAHVRVRVAVWKNPWASYYSDGYQIAQGLMAIASGGLFGMGLTLGSPKVIPAYHTDYIFAVICEEMGIVVGLCVMGLYLLLTLRGVSIAMQCEDRFSALLAMGSTALLALQSFIILGGVIKLLPLTGVTLPFVSYGGSSVLGSLLLVGLLEAVAVQNGRRAALGGVR